MKIERLNVREFESWERSRQILYASQSSRSGKRVKLFVLYEGYEVTMEGNPKFLTGFRQLAVDEFNRCLDN